MQEFQRIWSREKEITHMEVIKQTIAQTALEAFEAEVLTLGGEGRRQNTNTEQNGTAEATRYRTGLSNSNQFLTGVQKTGI